MFQKYRFQITILSLFVLAVLGWYFREIVAYVLIAALVSIIGRPIMNRLNRLRIGKIKIPQGFNALFTLTLIYGILALIFYGVSQFVADDVKQFANLDLSALVEGFEKPIGELEAWMKRNGIGGDSSLKESFEAEVNAFISGVSFRSVAAEITGMLGNLAIAMFAITFIAFFFLKETDLFWRFVHALVPPRYEEQFNNIVRNSKRLLRRYLLGIVIQSTIITTIVTTGLYFVGLGEANISFGLALTIGIFAGILNIIPYVGPWIGAILGVVMCISANVYMDFDTQMVPMLIKVAGVFAFAQFFDNVFNWPIIFSKTVMAHPLEIFIIILMAAYIGGVTGMIIAIPSYTVLRIIALEFFLEFKFVQKLTARMNEKLKPSGEQ